MRTLISICIIDVVGHAHAQNAPPEGIFFKCNAGRSVLRCFTSFYKRFQGELLEMF